MRRINGERSITGCLGSRSPLATERRRSCPYVCIDKGEISNSSDTLWIVDIKQNWVGEDKGERKALYAMNQIVAARDSDHVCDTMILGLKKDKCLEHLGKNKPGTTHPFVCRTLG